MNESNDFGFVPFEDDFGFVPIQDTKPRKEEPSIGKDVIQQTGKGLTMGALGTYGDVFDLLGIQAKEIPKSENEQYSREFQALERMQQPGYKPQLSDIETIADYEPIPRFSRAASGQDVSNVVEQFTGIGEAKTTPGKYAKRIGQLAGGGAAFGSTALKAPLIAGSAGQTLEELGAPPWAQAAAEMIAFLKTAKSKTPLTSKSPEVQNSINKLKKMGFSDEDVTLAKNALEEKGLLTKVAKMTIKAEKQFESTLKNSEETFNNILHEAFPGLEKGIERAGQNASDFYKGISEYAAKVPIKNNKLFEQETQKAIEYLKKIPAVGGRREALEYLEKGIEMSKNAKSADFYTDYYKGLSELGNWANPHTKEHVLGLVKKSIKDNFAANGKEGYQFSQMFEHANDVYSKFKNAEKITNFLKPAMNEEGINFKKLQNIVSKPENYELLEESLGKTQASNLKEIAKSGESIIKMKDKIIGGPFKEYSGLRQAGELAYTVMTGDWRGVGAIIGEEIAANLSTKLLTDVNYQNIVKKMIKAANESKFDQVRVLAANLRNSLDKQE